MISGTATLGFIRFIAYNTTSLDSLVSLHIAFIRSKMEYASVLWNNPTSTDSNKILKNVPICFIFFSCVISHYYDLILNHLNYRKLYSRQRYVSALFLIYVLSAQ